MENIFTDIYQAISNFVNAKWGAQTAKDAIFNYNDVIDKQCYQEVARMATGFIKNILYKNLMKTYINSEQSYFSKIWSAAKTIGKYAINHPGQAIVMGTEPLSV